MRKCFLPLSPEPNLSDFDSFLCIHQVVRAIRENTNVKSDFHVRFSRSFAYWSLRIQFTNLTMKLFNANTMNCKYLIRIRSRIWLRFLIWMWKFGFYKHICEYFKHVWIAFVINRSSSWLKNVFIIRSFVLLSHVAGLHRRTHHENSLEHRKLRHGVAGSLESQGRSQPRSHRLGGWEGFASTQRRQ